MKDKEKSVRLCRSLKTTFLLSIAVVWSVVASQASVALAYSPPQQYDDEGGGLTCLIWSVIIIIAVVVAVAARNRTRKTPEYTQRLSTALPRSALEAIVSEMFPKGSWVSSSFGWKRDSSIEGILVLSRNYFSPEQGCLLYLLTGLLPGALIISLMGRTEKVIVDMSALATNNEMVVKGQGLRGREKAEQLVGKLVAAQQASMIGVLKYDEMIPETPTPATPVGIAKERPGIVKFVTVVNLIAVAISAIYLAILTLGGPVLFNMPFDSFPWIIAALALFAALYTSLLFAFWDLKDWARVIFIVLYVIGLLGFPVGTIVSGIILYYLFRSDTKEAFASIGRPQEPSGRFNWRIPLYCIGALLAFSVVNVGLLFLNRQLRETIEWIPRLHWFFIATLSGLAIGVAVAPYFELQRSRYLLPAVGTLVMLLVGLLGVLFLPKIYPQIEPLLGATYGALVGFTLRDKKRALPMSLYALVATSVGGGLGDLAFRALNESSYWLAISVNNVIFALVGGGLLGLLFALPKEKRIPVPVAMGE